MNNTIKELEANKEAFAKAKAKALKAQAEFEKLKEAGGEKLKAFEDMEKQIQRTTEVRISKNKATEEFFKGFEKHFPNKYILKNETEERVFNAYIYDGSKVYSERKVIIGQKEMKLKKLSIVLKSNEHYQVKVLDNSSYTYSQLYKKWQMRPELKNEYSSRCYSNPKTVDRKIEEDIAETKSLDNRDKQNKKASMLAVELLTKKYGDIAIINPSSYDERIEIKFENGIEVDCRVYLNEKSEGGVELLIQRVTGITCNDFDSTIKALSTIKAEA